jgi:hypothetical protein
MLTSLHQASHCRPRQRWCAVAVVVALLVSGCGGGDDSDEAEPAADEQLPSSTETTAEPAGGAADEDVSSGSGGDASVVNADPVLVNLDDSVITTATTIYRAGTVRFEVTNIDDIPHEFGIARGDSYEALPLTANGAIDEDALGEDFLGKTGALFGALGTTREISFDLAPGNYVFFCNLGTVVSHAAKGQVLSVTVVE